MALVTKIKAKQLKIGNGLQADASGDLLQAKQRTGQANIAGIDVHPDGLGVAVDNATMTHSGNALAVKDGGIDADALNASVAGKGVAGGGGTALSIDLNQMDAGAIADGDSLVFMDANDSNITKKEAVADLATLFAGVGLSATNSVMAVDLNEVSAGAIAHGDSLVFMDSDDSNITKKEAVADLATLFAGDGLSASSSVMALDLNELTGAAIADGDFFAFVDATDNSTKKESVADLATLFAGDGLSASSSVMAVDLNELTAAVLAPADDLLAFVDASDNSTKKESVSDFINAIAGSGLSATNGVLSLSGDNVFQTKKWGGKNGTGQDLAIFRASASEKGGAFQPNGSSITNRQDVGNNLASAAGILRRKVGKAAGTPASVDAMFFRTGSDSGSITSDTFVQVFLNGIYQDVHIIPDNKSGRIITNQVTASVDAIMAGTGNEPLYDEFANGHVDAIYLKDTNTGARYVGIRAEDLANGDFVTIVD